MRAAVIAIVVLAASHVRAQPAPPAAHEDAAFDFMNVLADHKLHDLNDETWNAYGQFTYISSFRVPWHAPYTNANGAVNSFETDYERSFTDTFTLFFGVKLWHGAELYFSPEAIGEHALSHLRGLGGVTENFELQKTGTTTPTFYRSRLYLRQTFDLGGKKDVRVSNPLVLGGSVDSRRIVVTVGNLGVIDIFDKNSVTWDPRQTFFDEAFMTHAAYDFPADARGYSFGVAAELYWDDWAVRIGRFAPPIRPNEQSNDFRLWERYGDSLEVEHDHKLFGKAGAIRFQAFRNRVFSGRFDDAIAAFEADPVHANAGACTSYNYGSGNFNAPDFCWVRKLNTKVGIGINAEQYVATNVGVFLRAMVTDGQSEVDAFDSADSDLSFGVVAKGKLWHRPFDVTGIGAQATFISDIHARYLAMGGIDNFVGDGRLRRGTEEIIEAFYSVNVKKAVWFAADLQIIANPAYNLDRAGPIYIPAVKVHGEF